MSDSPRPACCKPCQEKMRSCSTDISCCLQCHCSWEEQYVGPYLPPESLRELKAAHKYLHQTGFRPHDVAAHSQWEEALFQRYCPPHILAQISRDHDAWEHGRLRTRT